MKRFTQDEFLKLARDVHGDKYDYSKSIYVNQQTKVCITCPRHGDFWQTPSAHIHQKQGCELCSGRKLDTDGFIERAIKVHGNRYDYSKVNYINTVTPVTIICPEHGEFRQKPRLHLRGCHCQKCSNQYRMTTEEWIEKAKLVHGEKYKYDKVNYINNHTQVCVTCPKHGDFLIYPNNHLKGNGCPKDRISKLEKMIMDILVKNNIEFTFNKQFEWLRNIKPLYLDFFLPKYNIAIECQGEQHLIEERVFKDKNTIYINDAIKNKLCKENGVNLIYFSETDINTINVNQVLYTNDNYFINRHILLEYVLKQKKSKS